MNEERETIFEEKFVRTEIVEERGQWVVYIEIGNSESSVKHRIEAYPKKKLAEIAANLIKRAAKRDEPFKNFRL